MVDWSHQVIQILQEVPEERRLSIAAAARRRLLLSHTPDHRATQLENYFLEVTSSRQPRRRTTRPLRTAELQAE